MRTIFLIIVFLSFKTVFADGGNSYILKLEICTTKDETIVGFVKTNDYFIDSYLNNEIDKPFRDFIIETVHFTREKGKFTYFEKSVNYLLKPKTNINAGYNLYQLQKEKNIPIEFIKSISIIGKMEERNHLNVVTYLDADNQFWLSKEPIKILEIGCADEWCCKTAIIYSVDKEINKKIEQNEIKPNENLTDFFFKKIESGQEIVIIEWCTE